MNTNATSGEGAVAESSLIGSILSDSSPKMGASSHVPLWGLGNDFAIPPVAEGKNIARPTSAPPAHVSSNLWNFSAFSRE